MSVFLFNALPVSSAVAVNVTLPEDPNNDWILLSSNELLKGKIKELYNEKLEFDSDELNTLMLDWTDIKALKSSAVVSIGFIDLSTKTGILELKNGKSYINGEEFVPAQIMTIIAGEQTEANYWSAKVSLGANLRSGNTKQFDYSANASIKRRTTESRFNVKYFGNYTRNEGINTVNNHRVNANFDWFLSKYFYLQPIFAEVYKDPFSNIKHKITVGSGIGYTIIDTSKTKWNINGGPAYTYTEFEQVEVNENTSEDSASVVMATKFTTAVTDDIDFKSQYQLQFADDKTGGYSHHAIAGLTMDLTDMFDLDLSFVWDHINSPTANSDGVIPKQNDYQFIVGFGITL